MMLKRTGPVIGLLLLAALCTGIPAVAAAGVAEIDQAAGYDSTLVEVIEAETNLTTMAEAIGIADLESLLSEGGPYTVFAPTDDAFASLDAETAGTLLDAETEDLIPLLANHLAAGVYGSEDLFVMAANNTTLRTILGENLTVSVNETDDTLEVAGFRVVQADLTAENGVVHAIDGVILPEQAPSITITRPKEGGTATWQSPVEGRSVGVAGGELLSITVLIAPNTDQREWYVQPAVSIDDEGGWDTVAYFGEPGPSFDGIEFTVAAIITAGNFTEGDLFDDLPDSIAKDEINVTRVPPR